MPWFFCQGWFGVPGIPFFAVFFYYDSHLTKIQEFAILYLL